MSDPLSEALALLNPRSSAFVGLRAGGPWALRFPPPQGIKFNAVVEGECWLSVEGMAQPWHLRAGDCFLLTEPRAFSLATDPALPLQDAHYAYRDIVDGIARCGEGEDFFLIGGRYTFEHSAQLLLDGLPPVAVVSADSGQAAVLHWSLQRLAEELAGAAPGANWMVQQLGLMMLVQALRLVLQAHAEARGWLFALSDAYLRPVLVAIHAAPARRWTVAQLALLAGSSRSSFAQRFKARVGLAPLAYVTHWRMQLAARELERGGSNVSMIAQSLGYDSDSAFSSAFKRITGRAPSMFRARASAD